MTRTPRRRFWLEAALSLALLASLCASIVDPEWIEAVFHVDPDGGSGALEWAIPVVLGAALLLTGSLAWLDWRRAEPERA